MNFLAHLYLSPEVEEIRFGCFIADTIKGSLYKSYSEKIQEGILLHRAQDFYTDNHEATRAAVLSLRSPFRLFAGVVFDIYCDHFLALRWTEYSNVSLEEYSKDQYRLIENYNYLLPEQAKEVFDYMKTNNWLQNYADLDFVHIVFLGMSRRTKFDSQLEKAVEELEKRYDYFERQFRLFFQDAQKVYLPDSTA